MVGRARLGYMIAGLRRALQSHYRFQERNQFFLVSLLVAGADNQYPELVLGSLSVADSHHRKILVRGWM